MPDRVSGPRSVPIRGGAEDRLQSWKEIAAYLGRDARSVYRWEKNEHLPVYRLQHGKQGSVYAFKSELDAWVAARSARPRPTERRRGWLTWHAIVAIVAVPVCFIAMLVVRRTAWWGSTADPPLALPFSSSPGVELQPRLSPDGRQLAFAWNGDDRQNFDIYVRLADTGIAGGAAALRLTRDPADDYSPAWSPDGAFIAFLRRKDAQRVTVLITPALGGTERALTDLVTGARLDWSQPGPYLAWSGDGEWLAVAGRREASSPDQLLRISTGDGEILPLTAPPPGIYGDVAPALSPDRATLAFSRRISWGVSELCLLPVAPDLKPTGEVKRLDTGSAWNASPAWLPDGEALIFSAGSMDAPYLARIATSRQPVATRLSGFGAYGWQPSVALTREGKVRLAFVQHYESANLWRQPLDGGPASQLIASAHRSYEPDYSPDGSRIAFLSDRSGYVEIWVTDGGGSNPQQWTFLKRSSLGAPRWSPDGRRIAFTVPGPQESSIYWIAAPAAAPRSVPDSSPSGYVAWAPDGRSVYFSTNRAGRTNIWNVGLEGPVATQITRRNLSRVPAVSRDGRFLLFLRLVSPDGANDLFQVPLAGGDEETLLPFVDAYGVCQDGVVYKYYRPGPNPDGPYVQFHRFATGETVRLARSPKPLRYGLAATPDCRYVLYSQTDYDVSDLMLVDDFR